MIITLSLFAVGYTLTGLLKVKSKIERLGLGFFLAFGLIGFSLFGLTSVGVRLDRNIAVIFVGLAGFCLLFSIKDIVSVRIKGWWWLIMTLVGLSLLINLYWPPITWDALTLYDFRAKLFSNGLLYSDLFQNLAKYNADFSYYVNGYPPLLSLVTSLSYLLNESVMPLFTGVLSAFIFLFYYFLEKYSSKKIGVIFTVILTSTSVIFNHSTIFYSNLLFSTLLALSAIYLFDFSKTKYIKSLIFCYLLLILSSWIRMTEPFYILIFLLSLFVAISHKKINSIVLCIGLIVSTSLVRSGWQMYVNSVNYMNVVNSVVHVSKTNAVENILFSPFKYITGIFKTLETFNLSKIQEILNYTLSATDIYFNLIIAFILLGIAKLKMSFRNVVFWFVILSYLVMIMGVVYFSIIIPFFDEIVDSARRMMIFTIPCMLFFIGTSMEKNK